MLKGIPKIIPPELLKILCEMGHTDELTIADANFPGHSHAKKDIRMDGIGAVEILDAVLTLLPLDSYVEHPVILMQKVAGDNVPTPIWDEFEKVIARHDPRGAQCIEWIDKWEFYDRAKEQSSVVIMSGETALYGNVILKKGVIKD